MLTRDDVEASMRRVASECRNGALDAAIKICVAVAITNGSADDCAERIQALKKRMNENREGDAQSH